MKLPLTLEHAKRLSQLPPEELAKWLAKCSPGDVLLIDAAFELWAQNGQLPPQTEGWRVWLMMAGRGFGKTRAGAEWIHNIAMTGRKRIALVAASIDEARALMVEGVSGLLSVARRNRVPVKWEPSLGRLKWVKGSVAQLFSGDNADGLRGPEHHFAWCDELAKWRQAEAAWDNLQFGLRSGPRPRALVTTTPRPMRLLQKLLADKWTVATGGKTEDNLSLPKNFIEVMSATYGGSRIGRQELDGELMAEAEGSLFPRAMMERCRVGPSTIGLSADGPPPRGKLGEDWFDRVVIGVDPPVSTGGDACGIVVAGRRDGKVDSALPAVATRAELAARSGGSAYLAEAGRAGNFVFDAANLSAKVTADPAHGLYVAPTSDPTGALGAWVRQFDGPVNVKWFGATGDGTTNDGAAFLAALAILKALSVNPEGFYYQGSSRLYVPAGHYFLSNNTLDLTHTIVIEGDTGVGGGVASKLRWSDGVTGIRIQAQNTTGASGTVTAGPNSYHSGAGSIIRNLYLMGGYSGVESEAHGIHLRATATVENFWIENFGGDGIHAQTTAGGGGADEGNSNNSAVKRGRITFCRYGLNIDGADANVWLIESVDCTYARAFGVWDSSFLGNTHINVHVANGGVGPWPGLPASAVSHGGNRYFVKFGQAAWCSANAPSGTSSDNQGWGYIGAGGTDVASLNIPAWASGIPVREGGGFKTDNYNARNQLIGCYTESGQPPSQLVAPTTVIGGLFGADIVNHDAGSDDPTIVTSDGTFVVPRKAYFGDLFAGKKVGTGTIFSLHNVSPLTAGYSARQTFFIGYEVDGVTPLQVASIHAFANSNVVDNVEGQLVFATRAYQTGVMTDRLQLDGANMSLQPATDLGLRLGQTARRYSEIHLGASGGVVVDGNKVVGAQGAALPADATDLATAIAMVNAIKARMVAHGLVA